MLTRNDTILFIIVLARQHTIMWAAIPHFAAEVVHAMAERCGWQHRLAPSRVQLVKNDPSGSPFGSHKWMGRGRGKHQGRQNVHIFYDD